MASVTAQLVDTPLWKLRTEALPYEERVRISYERAKSIVLAYKLTADDVLNLSDRYFQFHQDPIFSLDGAGIATLLTIHYNLCSGTLAMFAKDRPDVQDTLDKLLKYELSGQYCLTELGHGLDVINLETRATLLPNGDFELNTPTMKAAKFMPPTSPCGTPVVAVVFARFFVPGESGDRGIKPFLVPLSDGARMHDGIVCQVLSPRGGSRPVRHALTYFRKVHLPRTALLGSPEKAKDARAAFFYNISRVITGTLSLGALSLPAMRMSTYVAAKYSFRRRVIDAASRSPRAIITFSTQYIPILTSIAQTKVMKSFAEYAHTQFNVSKPINHYLAHFYAATFKTTISRFGQSTTAGLAERLGAQGLFEVNQVFPLFADLKGIQIAEGDILATSIRFAMELLLGRIELPPSTNPDSLLYQHEQSLLSSLRAALFAASGGSHRNAQFEAALLPQAQPLIEAVGHRMAYDAAMKDGVEKGWLDLFVISCIKLDGTWYSESATPPLSRQTQMQMELKAAQTLYEGGALEAYLAQEDRVETGGVAKYCTAPIVSDMKWDAYVNSLETYGRFDDTLGSGSRALRMGGEVMIESHL